jgi:peptide/nickel transport system permease protein
VVTPSCSPWPSSIGGGIITETVFSWPGIGLLLLSAVTLEDIPSPSVSVDHRGAALFGHLVADIAYVSRSPYRYQ